MRESPRSGMRLKPLVHRPGKGDPKVCITPFGLPVVPEVYMMVESSSPARTGSPVSGCVWRTRVSQVG